MRTPVPDRTRPDPVNADPARGATPPRSRPLGKPGPQLVRDCEPATTRYRLQTTRLRTVGTCARAARAADALLNVSSTLGWMPKPDLAVYSATKAYTTALTEALWAAHRADGVRVLASCPGVTRTECQPHEDVPARSGPDTRAGRRRRPAGAAPGHRADGRSGSGRPPLRPRRPSLAPPSDAGPVRAAGREGAPTVRVAPLNGLSGCSTAWCARPTARGRAGQRSYSGQHRAASWGECQGCPRAVARSGSAN